MVVFSGSGLSANSGAFWFERIGCKPSCKPAAVTPSSQHPLKQFFGWWVVLLLLLLRLVRRHEHVHHQERPVRACQVQVQDPGWHEAVQLPLLQAAAERPAGELVRVCSHGVARQPGVTTLCHKHLPCVLRCVLCAGLLCADIQRGAEQQGSTGSRGDRRAPQDGAAAAALHTQHRWTGSGAFAWFQQQPGCLNMPASTARTLLGVLQELIAAQRLPPAACC